MGFSLLRTVETSLRLGGWGFEGRNLGILLRKPISLKSEKPLWMLGFPFKIFLICKMGFDQTLFLMRFWNYKKGTVKPKRPYVLYPFYCILVRRLDAREQG